MKMGLTGLVISGFLMRSSCRSSCILCAGSLRAFDPHSSCGTVSWYFTCNDFHDHCQLMEAEHRPAPSSLIMSHTPRGALWALFKHRYICSGCLDNCTESDIHKKASTWSHCRLKSVGATHRKAQNLHVRWLAWPRYFVSLMDCAVMQRLAWQLYSRILLL